MLNDISDTLTLSGSWSTKLCKVFDIYRVFATSKFNFFSYETKVEFSVNEHAYMGIVINFRTLEEILTYTYLFLICSF